MIVKRNKSKKLLPLYEVEEVTVEQALRLLNMEQKYADDKVVGNAAGRLRMTGDVDEIQQTIERLATIWGPIGA
jgi:hypothetical protein